MRHCSQLYSHRVNRVQSAREHARARRPRAMRQGVISSLSVRTSSWACVLQYSKNVLQGSDAGAYFTCRHFLRSSCTTSVKGWETWAQWAVAARVRGARVRGEEWRECVSLIPQPGAASREALHRGRCKAPKELRRRSRRGQRHAVRHSTRGLGYERTRGAVHST